MEKTIADFTALRERITMFQQAATIMSFDSETIAPDGGLAGRAKRAGFFNLEIFKMLTSEEMKGYLAKLSPRMSELDENTRAMVRLAKKAYDSGVKVPPHLVQQFAQLTEEAHVAWKKARANKDFAEFAPWLDKIIAMSNEMLSHRADEVPDGGCLYDVLLDDYEDGMTVAKYDVFFDGLKEVLVPLIKNVMSSKKKIDKSFAMAHVDIPTQRKISEFAARKLGYDLNRGYISEAAHPFCSGIDRGDVRITTRYDENDFLSSLYSVLHECGHAIYDQNLAEDVPEEIGGGGSMGMHESQSRFYENVAGRSFEFWQNITDELKAILPDEFKDATPKMFFEAANESKPSFIRVEADELTYCMHIIIRYEIEKQLFAGECKTADLPTIWNAKYEEYLGITPPDDALGVLQDVHWSWGLFGYFPTYALGSAYAAQFAAYMRKDFDLDAAILAGDFAKITAWLTEKIHRYGKKFPSEEIMQKSFGEQLNAKYFAEYLHEKYTKLYELA